MIRLQKYLADAGVCSRRKAEELILAGKIIVNGRVIKELGTKVDEENDEIKYKGKIIKRPEEKVYIILNKPKGYICSADDEMGRETVLELVKKVKARVFPVGRLDYNTTGLLILTNDGAVTNKITQPKSKIGKKYVVKIRGTFEEHKIEKLRKGVILDGQKTLPAKVDVVEKDEKWFKIEITIYEGRNRQVRRMVEEVGYYVVKLKRVAIGKLNLGQLKEGQWRYMRPYEIEYVKTLQ